MRAVRIELKEANAFMSDPQSAGKHRHHKPVQGHRFSIGVECGGKLVGVATVGRPVAPKTDKKHIAEVTRLATDGTKNACSFLYGKAARIARELAFTKIQTFVLPEEPGTSLKAAGWTCEGMTGQGNWNNRPGRRTDQPSGPKVKWSKQLDATRAAIDAAMQQGGKTP